MEQPKITDTTATQVFWTNRYQEGRTGWDIGYPSTPIKDYIDQLTNKNIRVLIPGAGNAYEAAYLFRQGFPSTFVLDIVSAPLAHFAADYPDFPVSQLLHENFFTHQGQYDLILEQTFFCSFPPTRKNRQAYAQKVHELLVPGGKLVGLWFTFPLNYEQGGPPFGGSIAEYKDYFGSLFDIQVFEEAYNSIKPRRGNEAFAILQKR